MPSVHDHLSLVQGRVLRRGWSPLWHRMLFSLDLEFMSLNERKTMVSAVPQFINDNVPSLANLAKYCLRNKKSYKAFLLENSSSARSGILFFGRIFWGK